MASVAEEHFVSRCGTAMRVSGRVGTVVVGAHVRFNFDDAPGKKAGRRSVNKQLAEQTGCDTVGAVFEEGAGKELTGERSGTGQRPLRVDTEETALAISHPCARKKTQGWGTGQLWPVWRLIFREPQALNLLINVH
jgi:hypothetical protein